MGFVDWLRARGPTSRVEMLLSVGDHAAGQLLDLPVELADRYIARGYAAGGLSREYDPEELQELLGNPQVVDMSTGEVK